MATLMTWGNSDGIKGRCDDKCHSAKEPACHCMCGGKFHGKANAPGGIEQAVKKYWDEVEGSAREEAERQGVRIRFKRPVEQAKFTF